jgi:hypothetical protein
MKTEKSPSSPKRSYKFSLHWLSERIFIGEKRVNARLKPNTYVDKLNLPVRDQSLAKMLRFRRVRFRRLNARFECPFWAYYPPYY